jgi:hypothetical protein
MADLDRWKHVEELNIYQISLLLAGLDPAPFERVSRDRMSNDVDDRIAPYLISLKGAISTGKLNVARAWQYDNSDEYNWEMTLIDVDELRTWLQRRHLVDNFFFKVTKSRSDYTAPWDEFYAPKLAAAVAAWEAVTSDPNRLRGKSPKQALEAWLTDHAAEYDLVNKDGTPNRTGIGEAAKVANWQPAGGAPKTPYTSPEPYRGFDRNNPNGSVEQGGGFAGTPPDDEIGRAHV